MPGLTRKFALLLGACSLPCLGVAARAAPEQDPVSVGDRFHTLNLAPGFALDGWEVRPAAALRPGYDDNITWSSNRPASSSELELRGSVDATQQTGPYAVSANALLRQTWYPDAADNDKTEATLRGAIAVQLGPRLVLRGAASFENGVETGITNGIVVDGAFDPYVKRATFRRIPIEAGVDYTAGRFGLRGDARLEAVDFDPQTTRSGLRVGQDFRNGWESEFRLRGSAELYPHMSVFAEARAGARRYDDANGDSDTWRAVAGGEVELARLLVGEVSAGYAVQSFPNGGGQTSGLTYGAQLHWFAHELLSFTLEAQREFRAEVTTTSAGVTSTIPVTHDAVSIRAEWEPLRSLLIHAQAGYEREGRDSVDRTDRLVSLIVGATYVLTRNLNFELEFEHEDRRSNFSGDFERNRVSLGLAAAY